MTDRMACTRCGKIGFVRREHVIDHGRSTTQFYCGACNQAWQVLEPDTAQDRRHAASDRRRSTRHDRRKR